MNSFSVRTILLIAMTLGPAAFSAESPAPNFIANPDAKAAAPQIEFDSTLFDFGKITAGTIARHDFIFTNTGSAVLEIKGVRPSCGCTTAGAWSTRVEPGKTGTIPLSFNSTHFNGPIAKSATVNCNDPSNQVVMLQLKGTIWRPFELNPSTAVLNVVEGAESNPVVNVTIMSALPDDVALSDPVSSNPGFSAAVTTIRPGKEFQVAITAKEPLQPPMAQANITIRTSSTNSPTIDIPIYASIQPAWLIIPSQITLPPGPLDKPFTSTLTIRNNRTAKQTISPPVLDGKPISADVKELIPGRQFTCVLTFPAGFEIDKTHPSIVTVTTSDPKQQPIQIPVHQAMLPNPNQVGLPTLHRGPAPPPQNVQ